MLIFWSDLIPAGPFVTLDSYLLFQSGSRDLKSLVATEVTAFIKIFNTCTKVCLTAFDQSMLFRNIIHGVFYVNACTITVIMHCTFTLHHLEYTMLGFKSKVCFVPSNFPHIFFSFSRRSLTKMFK